MTKTDAEQHAEVWKLASRLTIADWETRKANGVEFVASLLAASELASAVAQGYETLAKAIAATES